MGPLRSHLFWEHWQDLAGLLVEFIHHDGGNK